MTVTATPGTALGDIELPKLPVLSGIVRATDPTVRIWQAGLVAESANGERVEGWVAWDGGFELALPAGIWLVRATLPGTAPLTAQQQVEVGPEGALIELRLSEP